MILGADIGNYNINSSTGICLESKTSRNSTLFSNSPIVDIFGKKLVIGEGDHDAEYRKVKKEHYLHLLYTTICLSTKDIDNKIVVGLPISQYKTDREELINLILQNSEMQGIINGKERKVCIRDLEVYPEAIGAVENAYEGIVLDIGGRTTDICQIEVVNNRRKLINPISEAIGTLNLYTDFIKVLNNKYSLDLKIQDTERILRKGLKIQGVEVDIRDAKLVFTDYVDKIVNKLRIEYSADTLDIKMVGGGSIVLGKSIKNRLPNADIVPNPLEANAQAFKKVGEELWLRRWVLASRSEKCTCMIT